MRFLVAFFVLTGVCFSAETLKPVPFTQVKIEDTFWKKRLETNQKVSIPHNYRWCEETGRFDNFAKAARLLQGEFRGIYFNDSDVYKVLEGTAYSLASNPDPELENAADKVIDWIAAAQLPNGYINTYYQLKEPDKKWTNTPVMHELYCLGHMIEAAVAYQQATGKTKLLDVAEKAVDHVIDTFGYEDGKIREVPGHEEIELALVKLYDLTGKEKYLKLSQLFIDLRGDQSKRTDKLQGLYSQDHKPVREQDEVVGHAVRAMYLYCGMTDIAAKTGDKDLIKAVDKLWDSVVHKKMYITGGIGARHEGEAFGDDYEMPNDTAYCETCAQIGLALWAQRMNMLHGNSEYADVVERVLYNGVLPGYSMNGDSFFYPNPLSSKGGYGRQPFFDCACCPTNLIRFIPSMPGYQYAVDKDGIIINQFMAGEAEIKHPTKGIIRIKMETNYPWDGKVHFTFPDLKEKILVKIRVPNAFSDGDAISGLSQNISDTKTSDGNGYLWFPADSKQNDFSIAFSMKVKRMVANPHIKSDLGRVALMRGPLVYCFEKIDNPDVDFRRLTLAKEQDFKVEWKPDLLGGVNIIKCKDVSGKELTAIPYYAWAHRELTGMDVWVRQEGLPRKPKNVDDPAWKDLLYRELKPDMLTGETEPLTVYETTTATASYHFGKDSPEAVFDELAPKNSNDHTIPRLTWWDHKGTDEWVALSFEKPQKLSELGVYWFDDEPNGGCRIPESWTLFYKNGGDWIPIQATFDVKKDVWCTAKFDEITATDLRVNVKLQKDYSGGVLEIQIR